MSLVDLSKLAFQCCNSFIGLYLGAKKVFLANCSNQLPLRVALVYYSLHVVHAHFKELLAKFGTFNTCNLILPHFIQICYLKCTNVNNFENYFNIATSTKMLFRMQNTLTILRIISTLQPPPCMKRKITCAVCSRSK
jgi:hypothetical protein